jgi:heme o synthase
MQRLLSGILINLTTGRPFMSPASHGADLSQIGRTVALLRSSHASFGDLVALMKPRVMSLVVFTALVGLLVAPGHLDPLLGFVALLCITAGAGGAGVLNMWYDADIDALMTRTAMRPIPRGRVSRAEALAFGLVLATCSIAALGFVVNIAAAALLAFTIFFYVVVYTMWLKRRTPQNIVIGGAAGAFPPVIGWVAATGRIGVEPLILFLIIFLWTPPHFWALSISRTGEYSRAGIPMLPVVAGAAETKRQILIYCVLLVPISILPCVLGFAGAIYGATAGMSGATMILLAMLLCRSSDAEKGPAPRLFAFSILYLFILFATLLADAAVIRGRPPA